MTQYGIDAAIGLDLGGTAMKAGLVDRHGAVLFTHTTPTEADGGADHVIGRMATLISRLAEEAKAASCKVAGVGIGAPGTLSRKDGMVISPPNLPGWHNVPVVRLISQATGLPTLLENDANNAALGEFHRGAGRGCSHMIMLTLGTGIGGGIIFGGKLWRGAFENAGEIGHTILVPAGRKCGCGQLGCLEAYASARATVSRALQRMDEGESSSLRTIRQSGADLTTEHIVEAMTNGDALATDVWRETCRYLAIACINLQHLMNPERIVLAGGMSKAGEALLSVVVEQIEQLASRSLGDPPELRLAELSNDAGFIGSALSVFEDGAAG